MTPRLGLLVGLSLLPLVGVTAEIVVRTDWPQEAAPTPVAPRPLEPVRKQHFDALRLYAKGRALESERRLIEAVEAYEEALKREPNAVPLLRRLVPLCFQLDREAKALEYSRRAVALDAEDVELALRLCTELRQRGEKSEARTVLARALLARSLQQKPALRAQLLFLLGTLQEEQQLWAEAASSYRDVAKLLDAPEALRADPLAVGQEQLREEAIKTWEKLGEVCLRAGQFEQAVDAFKEAQRRSPQRAARLDFHLSKVYLAARQPEPALVHLQRHLATQPVGAEAYEQLIVVLTTMNRTAEILPQLELAVRRDSFNIALRMLYVRQLTRAGKLEDAETVLKQTLAQQPTVEVYRELALLLVRQDRGDELLERLDADFADTNRILAARFQLEAIAKDRELVLGIAAAACQHLGQEQKLDFQTRRVLATLCRQASYYDLAEFLARSLIKDDPQPGEGYLELCRVLAEARAHAKLVAVCREAAQQKLKVPADAFQREEVRALALLGEHAAALELAQRLVRQSEAGSSEQFHARFLLVLVHFRAGRFDAAAQEGEALLQDVQAPAGQRQLRLMLGGIYAAARRPERAAQHLEAQLAISDDDHHLCNDLGYLWADQGINLPEAERLIRRAIELDRAEKRKSRGPLAKETAGRDNAAYIDSLAWVLFKRGRAKEAAALLEQALQLDDGSDDPSIWDHLGDVRAQLGDMNAAATAWTKAAELYRRPSHAAYGVKRGEVEAKLKQHEIIRTSAPVRK